MEKRRNPQTRSTFDVSNSDQQGVIWRRDIGQAFDLKKYCYD